MKLRLEKGSVKVRLLTEEINRLIYKNFIEESIQFSEENAFNFSVQIMKMENPVEVIFQNNSLKIFIPTKSAEKWVNSNQIGIKETIKSNLGESIEIVVEEDLPPRKSKNQH